MTKVEIVGLGIRLFAIFIAFYVLRQLPYFSFYELSDTSSLLVLVYVVFIVVTVLFMWFFPKSIAAKILPQVKDGAPATVWSEAQVLAIGCTLIGIFTLIQAIPDVTYWVSVFILRPSLPYYEPLKPESFFNLARLATELALALWLVLGSSGIAAFLQRRQKQK